ncbi:type VI secretion system-associated protein TagF [Mesorhizobium sp. YR577]|uniref:type VI secretion system-associated protein TagF n=1 Tax=Mesorhizobium sp. YR577 TaxID=1884373 RepID=UPI0008E9414C|nr:type VI secretion system-associated protein TagF [Mesorhizobium sp. YR577]SFT71913.1 type VI secretion system protein ImpM [Mesorhizobium sp. YR577]
MPDEDLILPGYFGKLPTAGDFVTGGLASGFVQPWDRWLSRHLARHFEPPHPPLRFLLGPDAFGPMAGVVMPSTDRIGRRFPLTLAAAVPEAITGMTIAAEDWFEALEEIGDLARSGEIDANALAANLATLPFPAATAEGEPVRRMAFWTPSSDLIDVDPEGPRAALDYLLVECREAG